MVRKTCSTCGRKHRTLTRRQCLLGRPKDRGNPPGVLSQVLKEACHLRDNHTCQRCGVTHIAGVDEHVSHIIRKSQCGRLKYELPNVLTKCQGCHIWWHQNEVEAAQWFVKKWPDRWEYLEQKRLEYRLDPGTIPIRWYLNQLDLLRRFVLAMETIKEKGL